MDPSNNISFLLLQKHVMSTLQTFLSNVMNQLYQCFELICENVPFKKRFVQIIQMSMF